MKTTLMTNRNLFPALPSLIDDFFSRNWMDTSFNPRAANVTLPAVNIYETGDAFQIEVAAPGLKRENFNVQLDNHVLTISAEVKAEQREDDTYNRREFYYGSFERSFGLPENKVDGEKVHAKYNDGILHITVPKKEEAKVKPARQISIS
jgi:HSP20 family protein